MEWCRSAVLRAFKERSGSRPEFCNIELIEDCSYDHKADDLRLLGKNISEGLALTDVAVFVGDWQRHLLGRIEHIIAMMYEVECLYL